MIKTERLRLERLKDEHAGEMAAFYRQNKEFLEPFEPLKSKAFYKISYQMNAIKAELLKEDQGKSIKFLIYKLHDQKLIGMITLNEIIRGCFQSAFVGYKIHKNYINQGYMTESLKAVVAYGFNEMKLHRIEANIMPKNLSSLKVAQKCGFINEGLSKSYLKINGQWEDHYRLVILNDQI